MSDPIASGFLSYARSDDEREGGRIKRLADRVMDEFETLTGAKIDIFVDQEGIEWGDAMRSKLDEALQRTTFFIPVLTPTYFTREECRKEMLKFVTSAKALGLEELLMSIRYVPVQDLREDSGDELKALAAGMQYEDWRELRLLEEDSSPYRAAINRLAQRLVDLTHVLEERPTEGESGAVVEATLDDEEDEDVPGLIDLLASFQPKSAAWLETFNELTPTVVGINDTINAASADMNEHTGSDAFAFRVVRSRKLAKDLEGPVAKYEELSREYSSRLLDLDPSVVAFMDLAEMSPTPIEWENGVNPFASILNLANVASEMAEKSRGAAQKVNDLGKTSRDLRPVLRRFSVATRNIADAQSVIFGWASEIESRGLADGAAGAA